MAMWRKRKRRCIEVGGKHASMCHGVQGKEMYQEREHSTESNPAERSRKMVGRKVSIGFRNVEAIGGLCRSCVDDMMGSETM